jgi:hypothetical protein
MEFTLFEDDITDGDGEVVAKVRLMATDQGLQLRIAQPTVNTPVDGMWLNKDAYSIGYTECLQLSDDVEHDNYTPPYGVTVDRYHVFWKPPVKSNDAEMPGEAQST